MSNNFAEVAQILQKSNPAAFAKLQMLSISIDPEFDDPKVLRRYGKTYAGAVDPELKHWSFATGKPGDIRKAAAILRPLLRNAKMVRSSTTCAPRCWTRMAKSPASISGNQWKPADLAAEIEALQK